MLNRIILGSLGAIALLTGGQAMAQDAEGYWEGTLTLNAQTTLRVGVTVEPGETGELTGTLDSPDQNAFGIPIAEISNENGGFSFTVPPIQGAYEAEWDVAEQAWDGIFIQMGQSFPLVLKAGTPGERPEPVALPSEWSIPDADVLQALMQKRIADRPKAMVVMGVLDKDGARVLSSGPEGGTSHAGDTVFEIGSMTKVFTALLLADMVLDGEISLDDPVQKYLPEGATVPSRNGKQITLRMLSMQNSGLPRLPGNMPYGDPQDPYADYTEELLLEFLAGHQLTRDPGEQYEYSNLGVGLLGYALSRAAGMEYEDLLRERILEPLGMADTAIDLSPDQQARFAQGHDQFMRPTSPWAIPVIGGAGALRSTAKDMLKFLEAALDPRSPIAPAMELTLSQRLGEPGGQQTALGWMILTPPTGEVLMHGGGTGGFRTHMALQPSTGRAVVVLTNAAVEPSAQDLALHALVGAPLAEEVPIPVPPAPAPEREEVTLTTEQLDHVTGSYRLAPGVNIEIAREGEQLMAKVTGQAALPIYPSGPLSFFWRVVNAELVLTEEDGEITGGTFTQDGREIPVEKVE